MAAGFVVFVCAGWAQFRSTVPLVVAPTTVTDSKAHYVDGLTADDLILYDNNVPQPIHLDWMLYPIDLVVAVETAANAGAVVDKLGESGILFSQLLAGDSGQTAVLSFSDRVTLRQDFTSDPELLIRALGMLRTEGARGGILDALQQAAVLLERRPAERRRIVLMVAEKRDRGSEVKLAEVMERLQKLNAAVYWLTYSHFLEPFTVRPKTAEDRKPEAERRKKCSGCAAPDDTPVPPDLGPGGLTYGLGELLRLRRPDVSELLTKVTGGRSLAFLRKNTLERAIQMVGEEVHRQYVLSFEPKGGEPGQFHAIRVAVKGRPDLHAKTRAGYMALP